MPERVNGSYNLRAGKTYMRVISLRLVCLLALISAFPAAASEKQQAACCAARSVPELLQRQPSVGIFTAPSQLSHDALGFSIKSGRIPAPFSFLLPSPAPTRRRNPVCYVIDTYTVAKEDADSDTTMMVGHSICTPASKFRVEHSREPQGPLPPE